MREGRAYYNENDRFACDWLSNLMDAGQITSGKIDDRSIHDVRPDDVAGFERVHFFAGIGGWDYALTLAGWIGPVWTGSCPCQPFSLAGKQRGFDDERHLWPVWRELICKCDPAIVFGEQVASATEWLGLVRGDLEALGYAVGAAPVQAASAGADHLRDRYWFVANSDNARSQGRQVLSERTGERITGPDGVANADGIGRDEINPDAGGRGDGSCQKQGAGFGGARHGGSVADSSVGKNWRVQQSRISSNASAGSGNLADSSCERQYRSESAAGERGRPRIEDGRFEWVVGTDGKARRVKPGIRLLAHGVPNRVGLLRGFGNAIDPRPAAAFIGAAAEAITHPLAGGPGR